jgi:vacuolar-type H+-ATPase subunit I/STV1
MNNEIITHEHKVDLCKVFLINNGYTDIIDTNLERQNYPNPDLTAKKNNKKIAIECGGLSKETKIKDLLFKYDEVIHLFENKGCLIYMFYHTSKSELSEFEKIKTNYDVEILELKKEITKLKQDNEKLIKEKDEYIRKYYSKRNQLDDFTKNLNKLFNNLHPFSSNHDEKIIELNRILDEYNQKFLN